MDIENRVYTNNHALKEMIDLLGHQPSTQVDFQTVASLLRKCGGTKDLSEGKRLHAHLIKRRLSRNLLLGNLLLQMYVKCGSLVDVVDSFCSMHQRNRFSWNFLITAHARHGQHEQAVCVFQRMQCEGFLPNEFIFASVISACASNSALLEGKHIHTLSIESGYYTSVAVRNALVNMYSRCGCLTEARRLFDQVLDRNVVSWTGMISAYSHHGDGKDALLLYIQMHQEGVLPNQVTFISMLDACAVHEWLVEGKRVHAYIMGSDLESDIVLATSLVNMYGKCGRLDNAFEVFTCLTERSTTMWTAMIWGCVQQDQADKALKLYRRMLLEGVLPDSVTYSSVFDCCTFQEALIVGKQVHATMVAHDGSKFNVVTTTSLLNMYGRCGAIEEVRCIFDRMEVRNLLSWTSIIASYVQYGDSKEAIQLFKQMQREGVSPDKVTLWSVVDACADQAAVDEGKWVHGLVMRYGLESDPGLATALINMYGKCRELNEARDMFDSMPEKNLVSWTAMITAYAHHGCDREALLLYDQMQQQGMAPNRVTFICVLSACGSEAHFMEGKRVHISIANSEFHDDVVVMTALVNMYGKCASQEEARRVFDEMKERNVISWNTMIAAYSHCGCSSEALVLFEQMQSKAIAPNKATFVCILDACASEATLCKGKSTHVLAVKSGFDLDVDVGNAIVNMYGKCGRLRDAHLIFKQIHECDTISWNTMIGLLAQHGNSKTALTVFEGMLAKGHLPDKVTYVAVLSACGHAGLVLEGLHYFTSLMTVYDIAPTAEHCHCMIHMFARCGLMQEGENFVEKVPLQPMSVTWMSLLNACKGHPDMGRGEYAVQHVIELDEENPSAYVMLSNIYAACKSEGEYASDLSCINEIVYQAVGS